MREGSNPNFCPPFEEGLTINFEDSKGDATVLEFLGLLLHGGLRVQTSHRVERALHRRNRQKRRECQR